MIDTQTAFAIAGYPDLIKHAESHKCDSREATLASWIVGLAKQASDESDRCAPFIRFWGLTKQAEEIRERLERYAPPVQDDWKFALCFDQDGTRHRKFAMADRESLLDSMEEFVNTRHLYTLEARKTAALNMIVSAGRMGISIPESVERTLEKSAGVGYPTDQSLEALYLSRADAIEPTEQNLSALNKFAQVISLYQNDAGLKYSPDAIDELIGVTERFDQDTGVAMKYAHVMVPEELIDDCATVQQLSKLASDCATVRLVNGQTVVPSQLSKEAKSAVGLDGLDAQELADVLPTLPRGDADLLVRLN